MITLPGYEILNPIYNGSRTLVYRGIRLSDGCPVVIKLLRSEYPTVPSLIEFRNQYQIAKTLNLSGITPILDLEVYGNGFVLIMADQGYISLADYLAHRELTLNEFLRIAIKLTQILEQLYYNRIIHEDSAINQWIAETLVCSLEQAKPLAELVSQTTQGNPFFIRQFLQSLYTEKLIRFHPPQSSLINRDLLGGWQCDLTQIKTRFISPNLLDFILHQLQQLPEETQRILKMAACLGYQFSAGDLATITEKTYLETLKTLDVALKAQLIVIAKDIYPVYPLETEEFSLSSYDPNETLPLLHPGIDQYQFIHDRVQQAAYLLIPSEQRQPTHLKIAKLLLTQIQREFNQPLETILNKISSEVLLNIINQLNLGFTLIQDKQERTQLALFNLIAGRKAKLATAYPTAIGHLTIGLGLLATDSWETHYQLTLELYTEASEIAYLSEDWEHLKDWGNIVLQNAKTLSDQVRIYELMIEGYRSQYQDQNAVNLALTVCQKMGMTFEDNFSLENWQRLKQNLIRDLAGKSSLELLNLPELSDSNLVDLLTILTSAFPSAFSVIPEQFPFWVLKLVERQMTQFLEGIPVGVAVLDPTGKPFYTNKKAQELLKTKVIPGIFCQVLSNIYQGYLNWCYENRLSQPLPDCNLYNSTPDTTFILELNQEEKTILLETWVTPTYDERGELMYSILAFQDITKRQQTEQALRQAEEKYRSIFENASEGLFQTTPDGRYISANPALSRILGYDSPWDLMSTVTNIQEQIYVEPQRRLDFIQSIDQQGDVSTFEFKAYRKDGTMIWISENARAVFNEQNELLYYEGFVIDITERKTAEEERLQFMAKLSELNRHLDEALDSEFELTDAAARFVPHEFLSFLGYESIVEVQLGAAVEKEMSILFADIRDFTTLSEDMTPEDNFKFINAFLSRMEPAIVENDGFIDKYIGDEIMALFGGSADDAVRAGISMISRLNEYNQTRQRPGRPPIKIGIGINTGGLMLGIVGGKNRLDSTVISDSVNVASRIENLTKNYGVSLLITHPTFIALADANQYAIRIIDRVKVKGKSDAVTVYEVFDADLPEIKAGKLITKTTFEYGLMQYYLEHYSEAARLFQECLNRTPQDQVAQIYLERCLSKMGSGFDML